MADAVSVSLLAGLRERRERGALSAELTSSHARVQTLEDTALSLLDCVHALVLDLEEVGASSVRESLADLRARISGGDTAEHLAAHLGETRARTLEFAEAEREHLARRDAELRDIIKVLTDGLAAISAGSATYHRQILDAGARFEAASRLSDLQRVRAAITTEVTSLRTAVTERQAADSELTASLRAEVAQLRTKIEVANHAARVDALTGAANRGAFDEELARRTNLAASDGPSFALLLADIDHFKSINDTYGHPIGDRVLHALVTFLRDRVRKDDMIARWGGEEFAVLLPGATARVALGKAKTLVEQLARSEWSIDPTRKIRFTMSVGVTAWRADDTTATIVERVDKALYAAKHGGRNRAVKG